LAFCYFGAKLEALVDIRQDLLRKIPSVERVLGQERVRRLENSLPRWAVTDAVRAVLAGEREAIASGRKSESPDIREMIEHIETAARLISRRGIRKVINATGIVIHTNLGRANLSAEAAAAVQEVATSYSSLEFDLGTGRRTKRTVHVESLISRITGCEDAFLVNNNAAAVLLALNTLADGREVIVSRGELVEIGGSFRLPEVMNKSGARMVEVGTTNRTRREDYEKAITPSTAVLLKVHWSNFEMTGFVESVSPGDLADLAHKHGLVMMEDLGSGALIDFSRLGIAREPMPQESFRDGVDVVTFSGDKLLGGPQAGIIGGCSECVERMKKNPLARAVRVDKMVLAAMEETLRHYLEPDAVFRKVPTLGAIACRVEDLRPRAERIAARIEQEASPAAVEIAEAESQVGGGSLPTSGLATSVIRLTSTLGSPDEIMARLRQGEVPIIARIMNDKVIIDLRTVQPSEDEILARMIVEALAGGG
jgi:L-seryl-tRNA(Ser) seleniumtransferase